MNDTSFQKIKEIKDAIEDKTSKKYQLEKLLSCCGLSCEVSGTPRATFTRMGAYKIFNSDSIKRMLSEELLTVTTQLEALQKVFNKL